MSVWTTAAADWARRSLARGSSFEQVDIDELTDEQLPAAAVPVAVHCARAVRSLLDEAHSALEAAVCIPLAPLEDERIPTAVPDLGELLDRAWRYGPGHEVPGLYLLERVRWLREEESVEYRRVFEDPRAPESFDVAYSAWRSRHDEERGWPFNRCIWLRCRPN